MQQSPPKSRKLTEEQGVALLAGLSIFDGVEPADLAALLKLASLKVVPVGQVLIGQEDESGSFFLILEGGFEVAVVDGGSWQVVGTADRGELLGEAALYRRSVRRSAEARARVPSTVLEMDTMTLARLSAMGSQVPRAIEQAALLALARRVIASNQLIDRHVREPRSSGMNRKGILARLRGLIGP